MPAESPWKTAGALGSVGLSFVLAIVIGTAFGWWLDGALGTSPWMFFVFFGFGVAAGVLNVYRTLSRYTRAQPPRPRS
jgi:ATP synthase protein I